MNYILHVLSFMLRGNLHGICVYKWISWHSLEMSMALFCRVRNKFLWFCCKYVFLLIKLSQYCWTETGNKVIIIITNIQLRFWDMSEGPETAVCICLKNVEIIGTECIYLPSLRSMAVASELITESSCCFSWCTGACLCSLHHCGINDATSGLSFSLGQAT